MILALDLGTLTGYARSSGESGTIHLRPRGARFEGGGMRYLRFQRWLDEQGDVGQVVFEEVRRHVSTDSAQVYGGLLATLTAWCELKGVPYRGVPVGTLKKHATGKGNASKDEMVAAMVELGHSPKDDNEADALALLHYVEGGNE